MKCIVCNTDFCWICGAIVDSAVAPTHFQVRQLYWDEGKYK